MKLDNNHRCYSRNIFGGSQISFVPWRYATYLVFSGRIGFKTVVNLRLYLFTYCSLDLLEHILHSDNCVAVREWILLSGVGELLVDHHNTFGQRDAGTQQIIEAINGAKHPVNLQQQEVYIESPLIGLLILSPVGSRRVHPGMPHLDDVRVAEWWDSVRSWNESEHAVEWWSCRCHSRRSRRPE